MFRSVSAWLEHPPVNESAVAYARRLWENGGNAQVIAGLLKLQHKGELYQLRPHLGWPARHNYPSMRPRLPVTWSPEELATARRQWDAREPAKIIAKTLHLKSRQQVYLIAAREDWPSRKTGITATEKRAQGQERMRQVFALSHEERKRLIAPPVGRARRPAPDPEPEEEKGPRRKKVVLSFTDDLPTDHLPRICPACAGRVMPDPQYSVRVQGAEGEELYHLRCAPARDAAA
jgi:hypothetical protein